MIDSTIVRAHQHAAGAKGGSKKNECIGKSKGGPSTKIHATCDALGNPTGFHLTCGQTHDLHGSDALLPRILTKAKHLIADKGYDADKRVLELCKQHKVEVVIPPRANRTEQRDYDKEVYKWRHLIENLFQKLKQYRALATRYDKTAVAFLGGIHLAAIMVWLN